MSCDASSKESLHVEVWGERIDLDFQSVHAAHEIHQVLVGAENVLHVCGTDDHGSTSELSALKAGKPIRDFIDRLNANHRFKVITNDMSTQVFGEYDEVMEALTRELRPTFERDGKSIFVMKVLGPLG